MIWMGVARPKDFVAIVKRLPIHRQRLTITLKRLSVANSSWLTSILANNDC